MDNRTFSTFKTLTDILIKILIEMHCNTDYHYQLPVLIISPTELFAWGGNINAHFPNTVAVNHNRSPGVTMSKNVHPVVKSLTPSFDQL